MPPRAPDPFRPFRLRTRLAAKLAARGRTAEDVNTALGWAPGRLGRLLDGSERITLALAYEVLIEISEPPTRFLNELEQLDQSQRFERSASSSRSLLSPFDEPDIPIRIGRPRALPEGIARPRTWAELRRDFEEYCAFEQEVGLDPDEHPEWLKQLLADTEPRELSTSTPRKPPRGKR